MNDVILYMMLFIILGLIVFMFMWLSRIEDAVMIMLAHTIERKKKLDSTEDDLK